jgi:threonine dehydrogenase-like Zn-dependent dehydrogenase
VRQLTCIGPAALEWQDVPEPTLQRNGEALIRPITVARCEIDPFLVLLGPTRGHGFAVGHEAIAEVVDVGDGNPGGFARGDLVLCSFQICCGRCGSCIAGFTGNCESYPVLSDYGMQPLSGVEYGGMLSDLVRVPHAAAMLVRLPRGVDPVDAASVSDNVADGYRAVAPHLGEQPGADVLVVCHGAPSIALYAAQAALALAASSVTVESDDDGVLRLARAIGADARRTDLGKRAGRWPIVVDCGTRVEGLHHAIASTAPEGVLHSVSYYATSPMTPMPLGKLYTLGIRFYTGRAHSAALLPEVVELVASGRLSPGEITSCVIDWDDAADRYLDPAIKLVVAR